MTIAVVVVAPRAVIETAAEWTRRGLVGNSLWVCTDDFAGVDPDAPNAISATALGFGHDPTPGPLPLQLAGMGPLDEVRVVWVRFPESTEGRILGQFAALLRELLPHDTTHWIDVVVPRRRTDEDVPPLAGEWVQFRVHPSDRPAPDVPDAGWDREIAAPLHTALALAGILGGIATDLPWARLDAGRYHVVRVFSRLVDGGLRASAEAHVFVGSIMPRTHAAEQHTAHFLPASQGGLEIVREAGDWLLDADGAALCYRPPEPSQMAGHPRMSLRRHLLVVTRFLPIGALTLLGLAPDPDAEAGNVLEFEDLGYNIGPRIRVSEHSSGVPDFREAEERVLTEAAAALEAERGAGSYAAPSTIWQSLARLSTALVDGGGFTAENWDESRLLSHGRQVSVPVERVVLGEQEEVDSPVPELAGATSTAVAAIALHRARRPLDGPIHAQPDISGVTATAMALARSACAEDTAELSAQLETLGPEPSLTGRESLLERVHGNVLGDLIRSRLDVERWARFARRRPDGETPVWPANSTLVRACRTLLIVPVLFGVVWWLWHDRIGTALGLTVTLGSGLIAIGALLVVLAMLALYLLFQAWAAFNERGSRRLELMSLWLGRALRAAAAHRMQEDTERVAGAWCRLLSRVPAADTAEGPETLSSEAESAPMSMRIGHPRFSREQMDRWLADAAAAPGWRLACLQDVISRFSGVSTGRAVAWLAEDDALPGGRLSDLAAGLDEELAAWRSTASSSTADAVRRQMAEHADSVDVVRNPHLPMESTTVDEFLAEPVPSDDDRDEWPDDPGHSWVVRSDSAVRVGRPVLRISPVLCAGAVRIQTIEQDRDVDAPGSTTDPLAEDDPGVGWAQGIR
ncbi:MAG: hypothetical protein LKI24_11135 [Acidipropionibacterium sp.]|jgi:hypothetical protein|nr:hypothetical protein [Acidipropionibacterium sp.]